MISLYKNVKKKLKLEKATAQFYYEHYGYDFQ